MRETRLVSRAVLGKLPAAVLLLGLPLDVFGATSGSNHVAWGYADFDGDGRADPAFYRESAGMVAAYFSGGNDVPGSFQQSNILHLATELGAAARAGDRALALLYGKYQAEYAMTCLWWEVITHAGAGVRQLGRCAYHLKIARLRAIFR